MVGLPHSLLCRHVLSLRVLLLSRWRTTLGMLVFIFVRDAMGLLHLWYLMRERRMRRVSSRSFRGVDLATLELVD